MRAFFARKVTKTKEKGERERAKNLTVFILMMWFGVVGVDAEIRRLTAENSQCENARARARDFHGYVRFFVPWYCLSGLQMKENW